LRETGSDTKLVRPNESGTAASRISISTNIADADVCISAYEIRSLFPEYLYRREIAVQLQLKSTRGAIFISALDALVHFPVFVENDRVVPLQRKSLPAHPVKLASRIMNAVDMTPEPVQSLPQLRSKGLRFGETLLVKSLARAAALIPRRDTPAAQAARRMGVNERPL
jgi:hypothetical protein